MYTKVPRTKCYEVFFVSVSIKQRVSDSNHFRNFEKIYTTIDLKNKNCALAQKYFNNS